MTSRAEPLFFTSSRSPDRSLFGWLHQPAGAATDLGLVVCNPFGYEAVCAHRSLRHFAEGAALAGIAALRFDYDGTGDSAGDDREPGRVRAWIDSIHAAIEALRVRTGVARVALLGVRLGALLAAIAAGERDDLAGVVLVAPIATGKAYVRELRALEKTRAMPARPASARAEEGVDGAVGFAITTETRDALAAADLLRSSRAPAGEVLLLDRDDLPADDRLAKHLAALGAKVEARREAGYVEMMLDPHQTVVPRAMIAAAVAWLADRARAVDGGVSSGAVREARATFPASPGGVAVEETAGFVDAAGRIFGITSSPAGGARADRKGVLLLNAGAVHHIGPNRLYVTLARRWASLGMEVLRLDMSGLGDSAPRPGEDENVVYTDGADDDVRAALEHLRARPGVSERHVVGLCSGAYNALKAAVHGLPIDGIVIINPLTFFWKPGLPLDMPAYHVTAESARYRKRLRDPEAWMKLLRGGVDVRAALEVLTRRAAGVADGVLRDLARRAGRPFPEDLGAELEAVARRRVGLLFVLAEGDPGLGMLETQGGSSVPRLRARGSLSIRMIEGSDHTFTPLWAQETLAEALTAHLSGGRRSGA